MRKAIIPAFTAILTVAVMAYQGVTVEPTLCDVPDVKLRELAGYESQPYEPSEAELTVLPKDTQFDKRVYLAADGNWYQVSVIIGGKNKSSIHRPELCIPSQGFQMVKPHTITVDGRDWHRVSLTKGTARPIGFAYTFFNHTGYKTSSHIRRIFRDVWDRSIIGRIDRWVMVTVNSSEDDDERLAAFLSKLEEMLK